MVMSWRGNPFSITGFCVGKSLLADGFPVMVSNAALIARFMGPTWGTSGADRTRVGPMLVPWTLLSGGGGGGGGGGSWRFHCLYHGQDNGHTLRFSVFRGGGEWVIKFNGLSWTADSEVRVVHISRVIIKILKKKCKKVRAPINLSLETATLHQFTKYSSYLTCSLTETEPQTVITNQPEESKERI